MWLDDRQNLQSLNQSDVIQLFSPTHLDMPLLLGGIIDLHQHITHTYWKSNYRGQHWLITTFLLVSGDKKFYFDHF